MADQAHQGVSGPEDQGPAGLVADPAGVDGDTDQPKVLTASIIYSAFILIHAHAHTGGGDDRPRLLRRSRAPPSLFLCPSLRSARRIRFTYELLTGGHTDPSRMLYFMRTPGQVTRESTEATMPVLK